MKSKFWLTVLVITVLCGINNDTIACFYPPGASLGVLRDYVIVNRDAYFDANDSYDTDGDIVQFEWDFTDNGSYDYTETEYYFMDGKYDQKTVHPYDSTGNYTVKLRVKDDDGLYDDVNDVLIHVSNDSDSDDMPDDWEDLYSGIEDTDSGDWNDDEDSDGYNNLCEFIHGTEPNDNSSEPDSNSYSMTINVPMDISTIQRAIDCSIDGDIIVVAEGTYYENIGFNSKQITLRSTDPNDPYVVASTIIDGNDNGSVIIFDGDGDSTVTGFTIRNGSGNSSDDDNGAGIYCKDTSPTIKNCVITDNVCADSSKGGGIYFNGSSDIMVVKNSYLVRNSSNSNQGGWGSGIEIYDGEADIENCVFYKNYNAAYGTGLDSYSNDTITISNCSFVSNSPGNGGGIANYYSNAIIRGCIVWDNDTLQINDEPNVRYSDVEGGYTGIGNISSDPCFYDINDGDGADDVWGTSDDGLHLMYGSACFDVADGNAAPSTDITGRARVDYIYSDSNGVGDPNYVDMGAYESYAIIYVDANTDGNDGSSWAEAFDDLQDALAVAEKRDQIWVAAGTYKPTTDSNRAISFELVEEVEVYGGFDGTETDINERNWQSNRTILSGDIGVDSNNTDNSYHVVKGADDAILDGFTITGGNANVSGNYYGGGMQNYQTSPIIRNCFIVNNHAYYYGGGVSNRYSYAAFFNCLIANNSSDNYGGGMHNINASCETAIINTTISGNTAPDGGGLRNSTNSYPVIINSLIWGNTATYYPDVHNTGGTVIFSYSDVKGSGGSGSWDPNFGVDYGNNIDQDPCFVDVNDLDGDDDIYGSWDDGLRLDVNSPCIDAGFGSIALLDDILVLARVDIVGISNGDGDPCYVDIGCYESYQGIDSDGDGMEDDYEQLNDLDNESDDSALDPDEDGLSNLGEFQAGTDPHNPDTDGDGMPDGWEVDNNLDPLDPDDADDDNDNDGRDNLLEYQDGSNPNQFTNVTRVVYEYDNAGQVTRQTIQDESKNAVSIIENSYDELGRKWRQRRWATVSASSNSNDIITLTAYDEQGNVAEAVQKGVGGTNPAAIETAYDIITTNTYNALGRITEVNDPEGGITAYSYYTGGQVNEVTDPEDNVATNYYDAAGRFYKAVNAQNHYTENTLDSLGRAVKLIAYDSGDNALMQSRSEYNGIGRVIRRATMADAASASAISTSVDYVTDFNYPDSNGLLTDQSSYYASGTAATTTYQYDGLGRRTHVTDALGYTTEYTYTVTGNYSKITDANGNETSYTYDSLGRLGCTTYPDDTNEVLGYDAASNVISRKNRKGEIIYYEFSALNNMIVKNRPGDPNIIVAYDRLGRLADVNDNGDVTAYSYDNIGRVTEVNDIEGRVIGYEYNALGRKTKLTYPDGSYVTYEYDGVSKMTAVKDDSNNTLAAYSYDGLGRKTLAVYGNDSNAVYVYNDLSRMTDLDNNFDNGGSTTITFDYTYGVGGNRLSMVVDGSGTHSYGYDAISQLADVNYPTAASTAYTYDELGNRTDVNEGSSVSYVSNNLNQYSTVGGVNYSYDDNGNLVDVNSSEYLYSYDCENRLVGANTPDANFVYGYDYKGRRVWSSNGSAAVKYCVDGDRVIAEYDGSDTLVRKFVYGAGIDEPLIMVDVADNNSVYYYHFDGLGSVIALSDANSDVAETYSYDVFGEPNRTSSVGNPYMFTGRRYDEGSGLYYYRTRYYAADIGRFLQPDTIGYKDGMNMYAYVHNNPVMNVDPNGLNRYFIIERMYGMAVHMALAVDIWECDGCCYKVKKQKRFDFGAKEWNFFDYQYIIEGPGQIKSQEITIKSYPDSEVLTLYSNCAQDYIFLQIMESLIKDPPSYSVSVYNCFDWSLDYAETGGTAGTKPKCDCTCGGTRPVCKKN